MKLTPPQFDALSLVDSATRGRGRRGLRALDFYDLVHPRTRDALLRRKFVESVATQYGRARRFVFRLTDTGRQALTAS